MRTRFCTLVAGLLALALLPSAAEDHKYLKAFPKASDGMERFVIELPHKERDEEVGFKVELVVGKEMMTDGVNRVSLGATIEPKPLEGWGFTYYECAEVTPGPSTLIAVPPGTPKVKRFVTGRPLQIRYNSRIPVVVYVPKGHEVRYRIWRADETYEKAEEG